MALTLAVHLIATFGSAISMKRFTLLAAAMLWATGPVWAIGPVLTAPGDEAVLRVIPGDALGLIVVNHVADTTKKIEAIGAKLNLPVPSLLPMLKTITGLAKGFDDKGALALAAVPQEDVGLPPAVVIFVPVTDYAGFVAGTMPDDAQAEIISGQVAGKPIIVTQKGSFALFAQPSDENVLRRVKAAKTDIASGVQPLSDWVRRNDIVALALPKGVRQAIDVMQKGIAQAKENLPGDQDSLKPALAVFELLNRSGKTFKQELTHVGLGVRVNDQKDLLVSGQVVFKSGGTFSSAITDATWPQIAGLDHLPADDYFLAMSMALPASWSEGLMHASKEMVKLGAYSPAGALSKEKIEKLFNLSGKSMQGVEGWAMTMAPPEDEDASLFTSSNGVIYVDDVEKYLKNYRAVLKSMAELGAEDSDVPLPTYEFADIEVAGEKGFEVKMDLSKAFKGQNLNNPTVEATYRKFIEALYGPEGKVTVYLAPANKHTIAMTYKDKDSLEKLIQAVKQRKPGFGKDEEIAESDKLLPTGTAWKMYISPAGTIDLTNWILEKIGKQPIVLPPFPDTPPLVAGVRFAPTSAEARMALPSALIDGIGAYVIKVRQMRGQ